MAIANSCRSVGELKARVVSRSGYREEKLLKLGYSLGPGFLIGLSKALIHG